MAFEVRIAARAIAEIEKISRWWRRNRRSSPRLFDHELDAIIEILEAHPDIGASKRLPIVGAVRVVTLRRTHYLVAYQVRTAEQQVWIVRVRYAGRRPLLRAM